MLSLCVASCGAQSQVGPATGAALQIGQPYAAGNWRYTVLGVERMKEISSGVLKDTARGEYVLVSIMLENIGKANFGLNNHDFTLTDSAGVTYSTSAPSAGLQWAKTKGYDGGFLAYATGPLPPGIPSKWLLVYDVTPGAQGLALRLNQANVRVPLQ
jgi:hypothetical protein